VRRTANAVALRKCWSLVAWIFKIDKQQQLQETKERTTNSEKADDELQMGVDLHFKHDVLA
jgi:hypothetical protein